MPSLAAERARRRARLEMAIRLAAPVLDLFLIVGDRVSRLLSPSDPDYVTPRMPSAGDSAPRGLPVEPGRRTGAAGADS